MYSDIGGGRSGFDRRFMASPENFAERRSGRDRRSVPDRRSGLERRSPKGFRRIIEMDRRGSFRAIQ